MIEHFIKWIEDVSHCVVTWNVILSGYKTATSSFTQTWALFHIHRLELYCVYTYWSFTSYTQTGALLHIHSLKLYFIYTVSNSTSKTQTVASTNEHCGTVNMLYYKYKFDYQPTKTQDMYLLSKYMYISI